MSSARRPLVRLYSLGSLVVLVALGAVTALVVHQQRAHSRSVAEALHHEDVRTALWRMETRVASMLAMTTSRVALVQQEPGSYSANRIDFAQNALNPTGAPGEDLQQDLVKAADQAYVMACGLPQGAAVSDEAVRLEAAPPVAQVWTNPSQQNIANRGVQRSVDEYDRRVGANLNGQVALSNNFETGELDFNVGPLASVWDRSGGELELQLARRIQGRSGVSHESYALEWSELSQLLLAEITDLFPTAQLVPIEASDPPRQGAERAQRLAALPAQLVVPPPKPAEDLPRGYVWTLGGAWLALVFALAVGGLALRSSYAYGDKHRRFTHAVTHELRTPLTTFRMYSEMLARGMVPPASQQEYHATLEAESSRLARLVDNVLRYARLEDGKHGPPRTEVGASDLVERCLPELARTCANAGARLDVQDLLEGDVRVRTDVEAVLQVLSNLVENACKYGRPVEATADAPEVSVTLRASLVAGRVALDVCDSGAGIPLAVQRSIFEPFDRGGRDSSDRAPGVGLGLALSRALARELGGELVLLPSARGAVFRLTLPR
jgi:signal transduction histidine kinase